MRRRQINLLFCPRRGTRSTQLPQSALSEAKRDDGGGTRDAADGSPRRGCLGGVRVSGPDLCLPPQPQRCSPDREDGCARRWEHPSLPPQPSQHDPRLLPKVSGQFMWSRSCGGVCACCVVLPLRYPFHSRGWGLGFEEFFEQQVSCALIGPLVLSSRQYARPLLRLLAPTTIGLYVDTQCLELTSPCLLFKLLRSLCALRLWGTVHQQSPLFYVIPHSGVYRRHEKHNGR